MTKRSIGFFILILACISLGSVAADQKAILLTINGAIGPATQDYISRGILEAHDKGAKLAIIQMDTPGGLDTSMRQIVKDIISSPIPIVSYVSPGGARAASAGTFIMYASHIAAMAPATNLGAASPVSIGGGGGIPLPDEQDKKPAPPKDAKKPGAEQPKAPPKDVMTEKVTKDAIAYIRSLAELRGRNVEWAEKAVKEAASIPSSEALKINVIDVIAKDLPDLLKQINGRKVTVQGQTITLNTENMQVEKIEPDWRSRFLAVITDPSVAYILLLIGIYGLFFEFANPGFVLPGVAGAICLLLALYAFQLLPINYAGLGLMLLGIAFMIGEAFMPSFGVLGIGGIIAFATGSILLLNQDMLTGGIPWTLIILMTVVNAAFFLVVINMAIKARKQRVVSGKEAIIGQMGHAIESFDEYGFVKIKGEIWKAKSKKPVKDNQFIVVIDREGMLLIIDPQEISHAKESKS